MARKTGGDYRLLHVPDRLSEEAYQTLVQDPQIQALVAANRGSRIVLHGIGDAMAMAKRRKSKETEIDSLRAAGALGEAFGYYFDRSGQIVSKIPTVGLRIEDVRQAEAVIAVAGGRSKAFAIASVLRGGHRGVLVTDEGAALDMIRG